MDYTQILGLSAALLTTIANIPQVYTIIKKKSSKGVSGVTYIVLLTGLLLWVGYGVMRNDLPIIIANGISSIVSLIVIILNYTSKRGLESINEKIGLEEDSGQ